MNIHASAAVLESSVCPGRDDADRRARTAISAAGLGEECMSACVAPAAGITQH